MIRRSHLAVLLLALPLCASAQGLGGWLDRLFPKNNQSTTQSSATGLAAISSADQVGGLRQALMQGAEIAVKNLAQQNGYLDNSKVRIPLPDKLQKADTLMRKIGMGKYADDLIASMNHAAEAAVPEARDLLVDAAKQMTVADATTILTGGEDAATQYFRSATQAALAEKFKPIVSRSMQNVTLAKTYDQFAGKGVQLGLIDASDATLEDYITNKALDGLFVMMAEEEKAIRANPLQATGDLARKVFSVIR